MIDYEEAQLRAHPELRQSNSVASLAKMMTGSEPHADSAGEALAAAPQALVDTVISPDGTMANITFAISGAETLEQQDELTEAIIDSANPPPQITVAPAGISVVGTETVKALSANRDLMSFVALAAIFAMLFAVYRNPFKAVAPLLPVVLALGASAIMLYATGMKYSPLTSISGPLIIAMGTEFNILLMSRYFEERADEPREAMAQASCASAGRSPPPGLTSLFHNFPLLDNFGKVTAPNIGVSLKSTSFPAAVAGVGG
jgi:predicted RND superfamily exporter protein